MPAPKASLFFGIVGEPATLRHGRLAKTWVVPVEVYRTRTFVGARAPRDVLAGSAPEHRSSDTVAGAEGRFWMNALGGFEVDALSGCSTLRWLSEGRQADCVQHVVSTSRWRLGGWLLGVLHIKVKYLNGIVERSC